MKVKLVLSMMLLGLSFSAEASLPQLTGLARMFGWVRLKSPAAFFATSAKKQVAEEAKRAKKLLAISGVVAATGVGTSVYIYHDLVTTIKNELEYVLNNNEKFSDLRKEEVQQTLENDKNKK